MLNSPVSQIVQGKSGVVVYSDEPAVTAKQVIVAIPPTLTARIQYDPVMPYARDQLVQRYPQGTLTKVAGQRLVRRLAAGWLARRAVRVRGRRQRAQLQRDVAR